MACLTRTLWSPSDGLLYKSPRGSLLTVMALVTITTGLLETGNMAVPPSLGLFFMSPSLTVLRPKACDLDIWVKNTPNEESVHVWIRAETDRPYKKRRNSGSLKSVYKRGGMGI